MTDQPEESMTRCACPAAPYTGTGTEDDPFILTEDTVRGSSARRHCGVCHPGPLDAPGLARLLAATKTEQHLLDLLLPSIAGARQLMLGERLPDLYEATLLGSLLDLDPSVLTGATPVPLSLQLFLGIDDVPPPVRDTVAHGSKLLDAWWLLCGWGLSDVFDDAPGYDQLEQMFINGDDILSLLEERGYPVELRPLPDDVCSVAVRREWDQEWHWVLMANSKHSFECHQLTCIQHVGRATGGGVPHLWAVSARWCDGAAVGDGGLYPSMFLSKAAVDQYVDEHVSLTTLATVVTDGDEQAALAALTEAHGQL